MLLLKCYSTYVVGRNTTINPISMLIEGKSIDCNMGEFWVVFHRFGRVFGVLIVGFVRECGISSGNIVLNL